MAKILNMCEVKWQLVFFKTLCYLPFLGMEIPSFWKYVLSSVSKKSTRVNTPG